MAMDEETQNEIEVYLKNRDKDFEARQKLAIIEEVQKRLLDAQNNRRAQLQFLSAIGGASLFVIVGLAWQQVNTIAVKAANDAIRDPVETVEKSAQEIASIRSQMSTTFGVVENVQEEVRGLMGEVETALGAVKAAEGGVSIANELVRVYRSLEELRNHRRSAEVSENSSPTFGDIFPNDGGVEQ